MASKHPSPAPRGQMIAVETGRRLHALIAGPDVSATPLVVLEAGAFGFSADWSAVQDRLAAASIRSLAYDRAGLGFSEPGAAPRDAAAIAWDLERLLAALGEDGPVILCGHSMAGLHARLFAARNPERIAGVVLIDATTPESMDSKLISGIVEQFARASRLTAWGASVGLLAPLSGTPLGDSIGLGGAAGREKRWAFASGAHNHWAAQEVAAWAASADQAKQAGGFDSAWPVAVVLAGDAEGRGGLRALQIAPAQASRHGRIDTVPGASHATVLSSAFADAVVRAITFVNRAPADLS